MEKEPKIVDIGNTMEITTIEEAQELLKDVWDSMKPVSHWILCDVDQIGLGITQNQIEHLKDGRSYEVSLQPVIEGVFVNWTYSYDKIQDALKIFDILGWDEPDMYCSNKAYPLMIKSQRNKNAVILIVPRVEST